MKVLFLDIDGVLNSRAYDRERDRKADTDIDVTRLPLVKEIVDRTGAKIVLTSTWRTDWDRDPAKCKAGGRYIHRTFAEYGLEVFDKTPDFGLLAVRRDEVAKWLQTAVEPIEGFVIIDDDGFGWGDLSAHFVKTDPRNRLGLEQDHVERAIEILQAGD
ncbi:MAG: hypothetical protein HFK10_08025 [Clostridia bacterium]|nr:hypothetical protein [Clostridia bacterium]